MWQPQSLRKVVRRALRRLGCDVVRYPPPSPGSRLVRLLDSLEADLVVDVGANIGQFAASLRIHGYGGRILSIEPLDDAYARLAERSRGDAGWDIVHCAAGDRTGTLEIFRSANSYSSSILPMLDRHLLAAPGSAYVGKQPIKVRTLDEILDGEHYSNLFVKVDTQGFESAVIRGAPATMRIARGLQVEMSLVALYEGEATFRQLLDQILELGFDTCGFERGFTDELTGRHLQVDGIFARSGSG